MFYTLLQFIISQHKQVNLPLVQVRRTNFALAPQNGFLGSQIFEIVIIVLLSYLLNYILYSNRQLVIISLL